MKICAQLFVLFMLFVFGFQVMSVQSLHSALLLYCRCSLLAACVSLMLPIETLGKHMDNTTSPKMSTTNTFFLVEDSA